MSRTSRRDGGPPPAHARAGPGRLRPPPLWRAAPRRLLRDRTALVLVLAALTCVGVTASAGPLYREAVADASLRLVLETVPPRASANASPVLRLNGGVDPRTGAVAALLESMEAVPGAEPARVTAQSVSTELSPKRAFDPVGPVVTGPRGSARIRLFGVADPGGEVVVRAPAPEGSPGVWLPAPVAESVGVSAGDEVGLTLVGRPEPLLTTTTRVAGVYAVEADGRTPQGPQGRRLWSDLSGEGFPSDAGTRTVRAHLAVTDLTTARELAKTLEDELLWSAYARLDLSRPRLEETRRTADAVLELRRDLAVRVETESGPVALRPSLASGVQAIVDRADELAAAARRGAQATTLVGVLLSVLLVGAAAAYTMVRRRAEVRLAAGTGRRPASLGVLHVAELVPVALLAGPVGWLLARALVSAAVGPSAPSRAVLLTSAAWGAGAVVAALVVAGSVAAGATMLELRRLRGHRAPRVPWVLVVVVLAAAATAGLASRRPDAGDALGPLDLLVPPLLVAALAAAGSRLVFVALRRGSGSRRPTRRTVVGWLARRRLRAPDRGREAAVTVAATGLAMLVFSLSSLVSLERTVEDRAAVAVGADTVDRVTSSWLLDPSALQQAALPEDGSPLFPEDTPVGRNPELPEGQSVVWRSRTSLSGVGESVELLVVDPARVGAAAAWGSPGGPVGGARDLLPALAAEDAAVAAAVRRQGFPSTAPALLVGRPGDLDIRVGDTLTVDTFEGPLAVVVRATPALFPGAGTDRPTLVIPASSFFAGLFNQDPRLRPGPDARANRPIDFQADLWSSSAEASAVTLARYDIPRDTIASTARAATSPGYVAAEQGRRYQVAVGAVFAAVGLGTVVLLGIRSARRSPAADRMLAWSGSGGDAPARARVVEALIVTALSAALAVVAVSALRPLAAVLLEPGDGLAPVAVLRVPPAALAAGAGWVLVAALATAAGTTLAASSQSAVEVLRGED